MDIAIMGAGLSGLSAAITLEKYGVKPTIFEKRREVGDRFVNAEALLPILDLPIDDEIAYFSETFGLYLKPSSNIRNLTIHSENESTTLEGKLGFVNIRGRHEDAFEKQLEKQVQSEIHFHSEHTYEALLREYSHVILATGDAEYSAKIQPFDTDLTVSLKGATVAGHFDRFHVHVWLNHHYAPKGYAYLLPFSDEEANIVIAYPDYPENTEKEMAAYFEPFYQEVQDIFDQTLRITDQFQIRNYVIGMCQYPRIGNTFFVGNNFGSIQPFLGFGQFVAVLTGVCAARDILGLGHYEEDIHQVMKDYKHSLVMRQTLEKMSNAHYDFIVKNMNQEIFSRMLSARRFNSLKYASYLLRPVLWTRK
ncbi:NAD(P)/FAD-dependent oxidoreductase [Caldalkalibacillus salinus]|uniref:NAD(P)/FAD-dependent oxidoreductase n=1 Tax=Caldalkalibacillus salinus TaxID=2803787 RepID=UPI001922F48E|nr:NAD(P)/FAD-dependent oxidoreductase [Caldalkalibacillus salinus]